MLNIIDYCGCEEQMTNTKVFYHLTHSGIWIAPYVAAVAREIKKRQAEIIIELKNLL